MSRDPVPADSVGLRIDITRRDRDRLMVAAAKGGKSMASYLRMLVVERLDAIDAAETPKKKPRKP